MLSWIALCGKDWPVVKLPKTDITAASRERILAWLDSPEIGAGRLGDRLKFSLILLDHYEPGVDRILAERAELGDLSWLGGPALGPLEHWPRNSQGEPLAHIATILLGEAQALLESDDFMEPDWPEPEARLPESGYLEVFHHLGTYGNPEDDGTGGWLVRHIPFSEDGVPPLVEAPADVDVPQPVCQPVMLGAGFSLPRAVEFVEDDELFDAAERVEEESNALWTAWRKGQESVTGPVFPTSHMYGHSDSGDAYAHRILEEVRPLQESTDSYVLVLSVESWTHFQGWFGDAGNFEVWMRASDLCERRFDQAWCMIRTDH